MFLRVTKQKRKNGEIVEYLALAESVRVEGRKHPQTKIVRNFGKSTVKSRKALLRLCDSIEKYRRRYFEEKFR